MSKTPTRSPRAVSWQVRMASGATAWSTWEITESPLLVGRSLGCAICIEDTAISRIQCEFKLTDGAPCLTHRSRSVATKVNGEPCASATLRLGDIVQFDRYSLIVDVAPEPHRPTASESESKPTTQSFSDSPYLTTSSDHAATEQPPRFTSDLVALFALLRSMAGAATLGALVRILDAHVTSRLGPGNFWLAQGASSVSNLVLHPPAARSERK